MTLSRNQFRKEMKPLAEKLLKYIEEEGKSYGVSDAKISIQTSSEKETNLQNEGLTVTSGLNLGIKIEIFVGQRVVSFLSNSADFEGLKQKIDQNLKIVGLVPENPNKGLLDPDLIFKGRMPSLNLFDPTEPDPKAVQEYLKEMERGARSVEGIMATPSVRFIESKDHELTLATNGLDIIKSASYFAGVIEAAGEDLSGRQSDYQYGQTRFFKDLPVPYDLGVNAATKAMLKLSAETPQTGSMPIVLSKEVSSNFYSKMLSAIDGEKVISDTTYLASKLGQKVANENINIVDRPNLRRGLGSSPVDSTGQRSKQLYFIKNGVLQEFAMSANEAKKLGRSPIGRNSGLTNVSVEPGKETVDELLSDINEGIYIEGFHGGVTNVAQNSFSESASGRWIKDGKITDKAVDGFVLGGKLSEMFLNARLANDTPSLPDGKSTFVAPTTRIDGLKLGGAGGS